MAETNTCLQVLCPSRRLDALGRLSVAAVAALAISGPGLAADVDGIAFDGAQDDQNVGIFVGGAGDINADGLDDLILGAWKTDIDEEPDVGRAYVIFGQAVGFSVDFQLTDLHPSNGGDGSVGFVIDGTDLGGRMGRSVDFLDDINGDGIDDLILGALRGSPNTDRSGAGEVYVLFGSLAGFPPLLNVRELDPSGGGDGSAGFLIGGIDAGDNAGRSVSRAGDVDNDGIGDILIGAPSADPGGNNWAGESYLIFGRDTGFPAAFDLRRLLAVNGGDGSEGVVFAGPSVNARAGIVAEAGDFNADGFDDIMIGAERSSPLGQASAGEVFVIYGRNSGFPAEFDLRDLKPVNGGDGSEGFSLAGVAPSDRASLVHTAGDVNDDGFDDLLVGAWRADPGGVVEAGSVYLVFGRSSFPPQFKLADLLFANGGDGSNGVVFPGTRPGGRLGSVSTAGDVNGDGIDDMIMGSWIDEFDNAAPNAGEAYVVFGGTGPVPAVFPLTTLRPESGGDGSRGAIIRGEDPQGRLGRAVSEAGDFDGDGYYDVVTGAWQANGAGEEDHGEAYLIFGRAGALPATILVGLLDEGLANPLVGDCAGLRAVLFDGVNYQTTLGQYPVGAHPNLGTIDEMASSMLVPAGLSVTLFAGSGLAPPSITLTGNTAQFPPEFDDNVSSLLVECADR